MKPTLKSRLTDLSVAFFAVIVGAAIIYFGDRLLNVRLEYFFGVATFSPAWAMDVFGVTFIAGIVVSLIYGLGGKMWAHFSPVIVRVISFYELHNGLIPPKGVSVLPIGFWLLIVVLSAEFAAFGGVIGEVIIKKTYGRTSNKALLHKKFQRKKTVLGSSEREVVTTPKRSVEGVDQ